MIYQAFLSELLDLELLEPASNICRPGVFAKVGTAIAWELQTHRASKVWNF